MLGEARMLFWRGWGAPGQLQMRAWGGYLTRAWVSLVSGTQTVLSFRAWVLQQL